MSSGAYRSEMGSSGSTHTQVILPQIASPPGVSLVKTYCIISTFGEHAGNPWKRTEYGGPFLLRIELLQAVYCKCVELRSILHFTGEKPRNSFRSAEHTSCDLGMDQSRHNDHLKSYIHKRCNIVVTPGRSAVAMSVCFHPITG